MDTWLQLELGFYKNCWQYFKTMRHSQFKSLYKKIHFTEIFWKFLAKLYKH